MFGFGMPFIEDVGGANCGAPAGGAPAAVACTVGELSPKSEIADVDGEVMGAVMVVTVVVAALVVSVAIVAGTVNTEGLKSGFPGGFSPDIHLRDESGHSDECARVPAKTKTHEVELQRRFNLVAI
jgi:hypothetical protein